MSSVTVRAPDGSKTWSFSRSHLVRYFTYFTSFVEDLNEGEHEVYLRGNVSPNDFDILQECIVSKSTARVTKVNFPSLLVAIIRLIACEDFDQLLADAVDEGTIFFRSSRRKVRIKETDGEIFAECAKLLWSYEYQFFYLRPAFQRLLVWISAQAVHTRWFVKLPFEMITSLPSLSPRPVGLEGDINRIVLHSLQALLDAAAAAEDEDDDLERNLPDSSMRTLLHTLASLRTERRNYPDETFRYYRDLVERWLKWCGVSGADVVDVLKRAAAAVFGDEEKDEGLLRTETSLEHAKNFLEEMQKASSIYLCKQFLQQKPSARRYGRSHLLCHDDALFEYNTYVGSYRLLCLPNEEMVRDGTKLEIALTKANAAMALTFVHQLKGEIYRIMIWRVDFTEMPSFDSKYFRYSWKRVDVIDHATDEVVLPTCIDRARGPGSSSPSPTVFFYRRNALIGPGWRLHILERSKSIKFETMCKTFSAALHPVFASKLYEPETHDAEKSVALYLVGWEFNKMIVRDYLIHSDDDDNIKVTFYNYPAWPSELHSGSEGDASVTVFNDTLRRAPLLVFNTTVSKNGNFDLIVLRHANGGPAVDSHWDKITIQVTVGAKGSTIAGPLGGGGFQGSVIGNTLDVWDADVVPSPSIFKGRILHINLLDMSSYWAPWGTDEQQAKRKRPLLSREQIEQSLVEKSPVVVNTLPTPKRKTHRITCLLSNQAFVPSTRECFWVPQKSREEDSGDAGGGDHEEISDEGKCKIETLETVNWDMDHSICFSD